MNYFQRKNINIITVFILIIKILLFFCLDIIIAGNNFNYNNYANVLRTFINNKNMVNYLALKKQRQQLDDFVSELSKLKKKDFNKWSKKEKISFWINAYNSLTLKAIIDHYPVKSSLVRSLKFPKNSIRQISGVWDKLKFNIISEDMTLNDIEHNILRKKFNEPRIHMALVCAAKGCPPLRAEPYIAEKLNNQLNDQAKKFLSDRKKFKIDHNKKIIYLSSIFKWFGKDFIINHAAEKRFTHYKKSKNAVLNFVSNYINKKEVQKISKEKYDIEYLHYDWTLNEQ